MINSRAIYFALMFLSTSCYLSAQRYSDFAFPDPATYTKPPAGYEVGETTLFKKYSTEYKIDQDGERAYILSRTVKLVDSDEAIESNNRIYLSSGESTTYLYQKARVIKPNGKVIDLLPTDIKKGVFENNGVESPYDYFALEGLEKGSIIDQVSYRMVGAQFYGELIYLQGEEFRMKQEFEVISPSHLKFAFKSLNGAPEVINDTTETEVNRWFINVDSVSGIKDQFYLYPNTVKKGVVFKLARNYAQNKADITNYRNVCAYFNERLKPEISKKQQKEIDKLKKEIPLAGKSKTELIATVENYLKINFSIIEDGDSRFENLDFIFENKATNEWGISILLKTILKEYGVEFELVLTSDRSQMRFDPEFEAYLYLKALLLYFPEQDLFIAPGERFTRGKYIPATWAENYGFFIREVSVGSVSTAVGEIKYIDALPYVDNRDDMFVEVDFTSSIKNPEIKFVKKQLGYPASSVQPYVYLLNEEARNNLLTSIPETINEEIKSNDVTISNVEAGDFGYKPYEIQFSTQDHRFVEDAGNEILFKVGELIGPQLALYEENERQYPVESDFKRIYERNIKLVLPDDCEVQNLEALNISKSGQMDGETVMSFSSKYTVAGNTVTITSTEYYDRIVLPVAVYDDFQEVINAAADFNKILLIIKKK